jgi:hypothetical protein
MIADAIARLSTPRLVLDEAIAILIEVCRRFGPFGDEQAAPALARESSSCAGAFAISA